MASRKEDKQIIITNRRVMPSIMVDNIKGISPLIGPMKGIKMNNEKVNHPEHYNSGVYEVINIIEHYNLGFHLGNVLKYILRAGKKHDNVREEIEKAIWYLNRYLETQTGNNKNDQKEVIILNGPFHALSSMGDQFPHPSLYDGEQ